MKTIALTAIALVLAATAAEASGPRQSNDNNVYQGAEAEAQAVLKSNPTASSESIALGLLNNRSNNVNDIRTALDIANNVTASGGQGVGVGAGGSVDFTQEGDSYDALGIALSEGDWTPGSAQQPFPDAPVVILQDSTKITPLFVWTRQRVDTLPSFELNVIREVAGPATALAYVCDDKEGLGLGDIINAGGEVVCPGTTIGDLR